MIRRPPRSTRVRSSAASDVYKRQVLGAELDQGLRKRFDRKSAAGVSAQYLPFHERTPWGRLRARPPTRGGINLGQPVATKREVTGTTLCSCELNSFFLQQEDHLELRRARSSASNDGIRGVFCRLCSPCRKSDEFATVSSQPHTTYRTELCFLHYQPDDNDDVSENASTDDDQTHEDRGAWDGRH